MNMNDFSIMVVDDEAIILESIRDYLSGYSIRTFLDPRDAWKALQNEYFDIIVSDYKMPGMNGLDLLLEAKRNDRYHYGILLTAYAEKDLLEDCINGDVIRKVVEKPLKLAPFKALIDAAITSCATARDERERVVRMRLICEEAFKGLNFLNDSIIGIDGGLKEVYRKAEYIAPTNENVLITGETGTGKEALARAIHFMSARRAQPFIKINCGAIPENLIESELFGFSKGAFSGADREKPGKIELAQGGTLFLDEIGELSPEMQTRLLSAVQEKRVERLGALRSISVDFRLISATNRDLDKSMRENRFRSDLYYRIGTYPIHLPPLRARTMDMENLVRYLVNSFGRELGKKNVEVEDRAIARLKEYSWPGNVRELENVIKRALLHLSDHEKIIGPEAFEYLFYKVDSDSRLGAGESAIAEIRNRIIREKLSLKTLEKEIIASILEHFNDNIIEAVKVTGIPKDRFYRSR
ncbi:MAG: sigma-54-dependent Fis family transcriptional regulator [Spirochaetes bacterium]|nr:MAG: sigma-54-dependent Fis family transcriptional regulator [Spirochaetota bacterium]